MSEQTKSGGEITKFYIVKTPLRHKNFPPRLFWTPEGASAHLKLAAERYPDVELHVYAIDLVKGIAIRV